MPDIPDPPLPSDGAAKPSEPLTLDYAGPKTGGPPRLEFKGAIWVLDGLMVLQVIVALAAAIGVPGLTLPQAIACAVQLIAGLAGRVQSVEALPARYRPAPLPDGGERAFFTPRELAYAYADMSRNVPNLGLTDLLGWARGLTVTSVTFVVMVAAVSAYHLLVGPAPGPRDVLFGLSDPVFEPREWIPAVMYGLTMFAHAYFASNFLTQMARNANLARGCHE